MCFRPVICKVRDTFGRASVRIFPCGKCSDCLAARQNAWKLRMIEEFGNWKNVYFFTLTYSDDYLPISDAGVSTVCKRDLQLWLKAFRMRFLRKYGYDCEFKYFIASEYAPDGMYMDRHGNYRRSTCRPHYHGLIFTDEDEVVIKSQLFSYWSYGFIKVDQVKIDRETYSSVSNYVSKYCCKGCFASRQSDIKQGKCEDTFNLISKGLGRSFIDKYRDSYLCGADPSTYVPDDVLRKIIAKRFVLDGEYKYRMPRYWLDNIYKLPEYVTKDKYDVQKGCYIRQTVKRFSSRTPLSLQLSSEFSRRQSQKLSELLEEWRMVSSSGDVHSISYFWESADDLEFKDLRKLAKLESFYTHSAIRNSSLCFNNK